MKSSRSAQDVPLMQMYRALQTAYGPQHWWPGDSPTEIVIGAILTQNTNWKNVEKAIGNLKAKKMLDWTALRRVSSARLSRLIRPAGYYNIKARRMKNFVAWLFETYDGDLDRLRSIKPAKLRRELLDVNGIGPETADSIMLYALDIPTFVIDAYTGRIARRHFLADESAEYDDLKEMFESRLRRRASLFNEYHALIVRVAKEHCRTRAVCSGCPLEAFPHDADRH